MNPSRRRMSRWGAAILISFAAATPALAQKKGEDPLPPYDVSPLERSGAWVPWVFAFIFAAGAIGLAFKNPHRSHLD